MIGANYERTGCYFWASRSMLTLHFINRGFRKYLKCSFVPLYFVRPKKDAKDFQRVKIEYVRTIREAAAMERKFARLRKRHALLRSAGVEVRNE